MKTSKALEIVIMLIQVAGLIVFAAGMYSMLGVFGTVLPQGDGGGIDLEMTDPVIIPLHLTPVNNGYLEIKLSVSISLVAENNQVIATDSAVVTVPPGTQVPIDLELSIPLSTAQQYLQEGADVDWVTEVEITTLFDLISFTNTITMSGGGQ